MEHPDRFNWLMQIHLRLLLPHYLELCLLILISILYKRLTKNQLGLLICLSIGLLVTDITLSNSYLNKIFGTIQLIQFWVIIFGLMVYPAIKSKHLSVLLVVIAFGTATDCMQNAYAARGWYNLFICNFYYMVSAPLFYILFYNMLRSTGARMKGYLIVTAISEMFFLYDYFAHSNLQINYLSGVIFYLQHIIIGGWIIGRLAMGETIVVLTRDPFFWICVGRIVLSLVEIFSVGLHPYLVANFIEIYKSPFFNYSESFALIFLNFCYFYAFLLCAMQLQNRLSFSFLKPSQNKALRH
jgi:hypothetical protein